MNHTQPVSKAARRMPANRHELTISRGPTGRGVDVERSVEDSPLTGLCGSQSTGADEQVRTS